MTAANMAPFEGKVWDPAKQQWVSFPNPEDAWLWALEQPGATTESAQKVYGDFSQYLSRPAAPDPSTSWGPAAAPAPDPWEAFLTAADQGQTPEQAIATFGAAGGQGAAEALSEVERRRRFSEFMGRILGGQQPTEAEMRAAGLLDAEVAELLGEAGRRHPASSGPQLGTLSPQQETLLRSGQANPEDFGDESKWDEGSRAFLAKVRADRALAPTIEATRAAAGTVQAAPPPPQAPPPPPPAGPAGPQLPNTSAAQEAWLEALSREGATLAGAQGVYDATIREGTAGSNVTQPGFLDQYPGWMKELAQVALAGGQIGEVDWTRLPQELKDYLRLNGYTFAYGATPTINPETGQLETRLTGTTPTGEPTRSGADVAAAAALPSTAAAKPGPIVGAGLSAEQQSLIDIARARYEPGAGDRYAAKAATSVERQPFTWTPPDVFQQAVTAATERLKNVGGLDKETLGAIEAFYRKPYEEAGEKLLQQVTEFFRGRGMADSDRRGLQMLEAVKRTQKQIAENVTIPLTKWKIEQEQTLLQNAIDQAAKLGVEWTDMEFQAAELMGEYQGRPTAQMTIAKMPIEYQVQVAEGWDYEYTDPATGTKSTKHVYGNQEWTQMDRRDAAAVAIEGFEYTNEAGKQIHVMGAREMADEDWARSEKTRSGYDRIMTDVQGNPLFDNRGRPLVEHVMGVQGLEKYRIDLEADLKQQGLDNQAAQWASEFDYQKKIREGYTAMVMTPQGPREVWIEGAVGLEKAKNQLAITLEQMGIDAASALLISEKDLDEKTRTGYWTTKMTPSGPVQVWVKGTEQFQKDVIADTRSYEDKVREGYTTTIYTPQGPKTVLIQGTVGLEEARMQLQKDLEQMGIDAAEARQLSQQEFDKGQARDQRTWAEDQRVGYDRVVETWNGTRIERRTVHVTGTDELANIREWGGWTMQVQEDGTYKMTWVEGSVENEQEAQRVANKLVREGWDRTEALEYVRYIRENTFGNMTVLRQQYTDARKRYWESQGLTPAEAKRRAGTELTAMGLDQDGATFRTLQQELEQMQITAADKRYDAESRTEMLLASFTALASIGGDIADFLGIGGEGALGALGVTEFLGSDSISFRRIARARAKAAGLTDSLIDDIFGVDVSSAHPPIIENGIPIWEWSDNANGYIDKAGNVWDPVNRTLRNNLDQYVPEDQWASLGKGPWTPAEGGLLSPIRRLGGWVNTKLFGEAGTAAQGWATGLALSGLIVGGVWKGIQSIKNWWSNKKAKEKADIRAERAAFDDYIADMPEAAATDIQTQYTLLGLERGDRGDVYDLMATAMEQDDPEAYLRGLMRSRDSTRGKRVAEMALWAYNYTPADHFGVIATQVRALNDADFWGRMAVPDGASLSVLATKVLDMTEGEENQLVTVWRMIPKAGKTEDLPDYVSDNPNDEQLAKILRDVANFTADVGILSSAEIETNLRDLNRLNILAKDPSDVTRSQSQQINAIWDQLGREPTAPLGDRMRLLRTEIAAGGTAATMSEGAREAEAVDYAPFLVGLTQAQQDEFMELVTGNVDPGVALNLVKG